MKLFLFVIAIALTDCLQGVPDSYSIKERGHIQKYLDNLKKSGYDKKELPVSSGDPGQAINVTCAIHFVDINKVDEINMGYSASFYFFRTWQDSRLAFTDQNISTVILKDVKYIWTPDLYFVNERGGILNNLITNSVLIRISKNGTVFLSDWLSLTFSCPMDFRKYPHDTQICISEIMSYAYQNTELNMSWSFDILSPVSVSPLVSLLTFRVTDVKEGITTMPISPIGFTVMKFQLGFERKAGFFITRLYVPFIILVFLSWASFWIPAQLPIPRLTLLFIVLYMMVNIGNDINGQVPKTSYAKGSDVWIAVCESLVFATIVEFVAAHILSKSKETPKNVTCTNDSEYRSVPDSDPKITCLSNETSNNTVNKNTNRRTKDQLFPSSRIDKVSSIVFPVLFIFFNFVYWITYCN